MELYEHLKHDSPVNAGFEIAMESVLTPDGYVFTQSQRLMPSLIEVFDAIPFKESSKWSDINKWLEVNCNNLHSLYMLQLEKDMQIANVILEFSIKKLLQA